VSRRVRHILLLTLALLLAGPAAARAPKGWYAVEVIVFAWTDPAGRLSERWPDDPGLPPTADAVEPEGLGPVPAGRPVAALAPEDATLAAEAWQRLERAGAVRPLVRAAWAQAPLAPDAAMAVRIHGGLPEAPWLTPQAPAGAMPAFPPDGLAAPTPLDEQAAGAGAPGAAQVAGDAGPYVPPEAVDGTVRVTLSRYLHVAVDLVYRGALPERLTDPVTGTEVTRERRQTFRLSERRRVRVGEVHYFDHPAFGVLVQVRRAPCPPGARCGEGASARQEETR